MSHSVKITRNHGSLVNAIMEQSKQDQPVVGMGATRLMYSDRHPYTITKVSADGKTIEVQADTATRTDKNGMSDSQTYTYTANPNGSTDTVTLRKNGGWVTKGQGMVNGQKWAIGYREEFYDFTK
jgi:hypothetical protein